MTIWAIPYLGVQYHLWVDQAKSFRSFQFHALKCALGCKEFPVAVESVHWSLIAERYPKLLRRISHKIITEHPTAPLYLIIDYANLAMSHMIGSEWFTLNILAFGAQPHLPICDYSQQPEATTNRIELMAYAHRDYEATVTAIRVKHALHTAPPHEVVINIRPGNEVLVFRDKKAGMDHTPSCTGTKNSPSSLTQKA